MHDLSSIVAANVRAVLGTYERAIREGRYNLADEIATASPDLQEYFARVQAKLKGAR